MSEDQSDFKKVLLIDDERTMHVMLRSVLSANGFEVVSAMTGEEGLALAAQCLPDIIILDVIMPKLKGREVCKQLKADPVTSSIPVIFLTAKDSDDDVNAEMAVGAVGHITKPINPMLLIKNIRKILGL